MSQMLRNDDFEDLLEGAFSHPGSSLVNILDSRMYQTEAKTCPPQPRQPQISESSNRVPSIKMLLWLEPGAHLQKSIWYISAFLVKSNVRQFT